MIDDSTIIKHEFGDWTVIERDVEKTKAYNRIIYKCQCKCGMIQSISYHDLKIGRSRACQQCATSGTNNHAFVDKSGLIIGDFQIIRYDHTENSMSYWFCKNVITGKFVVKSDNNIQVIRYRARKKLERINSENLNKTKIPFTFISKENYG